LQNVSKGQQERAAALRRAKNPRSFPLRARDIYSHIQRATRGAQETRAVHHGPGDGRQWTIEHYKNIVRHINFGVPNTNDTLGVMPPKRLRMPTIVSLQRYPGFVCSVCGTGNLFANDPEDLPETVLMKCRKCRQMRRYRRDEVRHLRAHRKQ
jgi:hypothetical protein